ncbi:MAG: manganese efflux pump MntP family protein [Bacteroidales bacterium]|nr:manganese efflux pump MntP family protein [Bacteroidales bacterium]
MNFFEALLLSLALCVDTLVVSATTALRSKMPYRQGLLMALILGFCQFAFPLMGAIIGDVARSFIEAVDHWVAFGLLAFVGGKMIVEGIRNDDEGSTSKYKSLNVATYFLLGIATSIDGLAVGIGLGLDNPMSTVLWVVATIGIVTFIVSMVGIYLGKRNIPVPERTANIIAGLVLIGLGAKILIEHLWLN